MTRRAKFLAGAVTGVLVLGLAACGDDDSGDTSSETEAPDDTADTSGDASSPEAYVGAVCQGLSDWLDTVNASLTEAESRDNFIANLEVMEEATDALRDDFEAAGAPDVPGGAGIAETLVSAADEFSGAVGVAIDAAGELPADATEDDAAGIVAALEAAFNGFDQIVSNPPPELEEVVAEVPECEGVL